MIIEPTIMKEDINLNGITKTTSYIKQNNLNNINYNSKQQYYERKVIFEDITVGINSFIGINNIGNICYPNAII